MNQNRPFFSTNTNLYDESFRSTAPTTLNGQNVILSQEQQRRIYDTLNTSIVGNNFGLNTTIYPENIHVMQAQKQIFPGGATFTFTQQQPQPQSTQGMCCKCPVPNTVAFDPNSFHSGVNSFFPSSVENPVTYSGVPQCGLDYLKYQKELSRNPFQLNFHYDHSTSCSDLLRHFTQVPASKGYPDFCNINGALQQNQVCSDFYHNAPVFFPLPPIEFSSNAKKLILSKIVAAPDGHVVDVLTENEKNEINKKKVSFSDDNSNSPARNEKSSQITSDCICEAKKCKNGPKKTKKQPNNSPTDEANQTKKIEKKKKDKKQKKSNRTSFDSTVSSDTESKSDSEKPKKYRWWNKRQKTDEPTSDTSDTEAEQRDPKVNENIEKKDNPSITLNADTSDPQDTSDSSNQHPHTYRQSE